MNIQSSFPLNNFKQTQKMNPFWSSWSCFIDTIKGKNISKSVMWQNFKKLVDKDDYDKEELDELIVYLQKVNTTLS